MNLRFSHTRLMVDDMAASIHFYHDLLGLPIQTRTEEDIYVEFAPNPATLSLYRKDFMSGIAGTSDLPLRAAAQDAVLIWFEVDNVDEVYETLLAQGVEFVAPPTDRAAWALRTAHLRDPDGNLIEIGQNIPMG